MTWERMKGADLAEQAESEGNISDLVNLRYDAFGCTLEECAVADEYVDLCVRDYDRARRDEDALRQHATALGFLLSQAVEMLMSDDCSESGYEAAQRLAKSAEEAFAAFARVGKEPG